MRVCVRRRRRKGIIGRLLAMGKGKGKANGGEPNKPMRARLDYLQEASTYMHEAVHGRPAEAPPSEAAVIPGVNYTVAAVSNNQQAQAQPSAAQRHFSSQMKKVSLKSKPKVRVPRNVKRMLCKHCHTRLDSASTSEAYMENHSRGGRKPWADVRVVSCKSCGTKKRYPVGAKRQLRKAQRLKAEADKEIRASPTPITGQSG